ncbi:DUF4398 domain-containing protein [Frateuria terrea]|uniref:DUF4398 domain-containing protein n=1 Tax=Frateuria terrea TaxID=529704 RepID=A0A1H6VKT9_9GAMM|nr:DUF4398 domain-containing protein [Frateuria terrea]SEJ05231.1 protein of unknown function [Frateuria terrea]SFP62863.1 protein of unknown function [Frateuria terrea]
MVHIFSRLPRRLKRIGRASGGLTLVVALLALAGCASVPPPDASMNQAQALLQSARDAGAADYDPVDLGFAQAKFQQAQAAMATRKYADAANLAEEARADAELARTRAQLGSARAQIQAKVDENTRLRQQTEQAPAQPAPAAAPAPASSAPQTLQDMPAPSSSVLSAPLPQDGGFQPMPAPSQSTHQGGQR